MRRCAPFAVLLCHLAALASAAESSKAIDIKIALIPPRHIVVNWKNPVPGAAGHIIEWGTKPDDDFVPLGFFPPGQTSYTHPDLMWETPNYYRARAYHGPASVEVEISLPKDLSSAEYKRRFEAPEDYTWAGPKITPDAAPLEKKSIRDAATAAAAAPTNFKIALMPVTVSAFQLTWTDRASDEEGTMIELKKEGETEFQVVALVKPNVNSFGWAFEPPIRKGVLRLRPYYYGEASKLVHLTTPKEPASAADAKPKADTKPAS
ncbi:MAG TPA: hypothetical protein VM029_16095 [Opitutaceae bacterium]|nr:hypothetical protein [Opitutaceae bacterium]